MREQSELDQQWLLMVLRFGCGVTLTDITASLGKPESIEVFTLKESPYQYRPLLYYVYGNFALIAPAYDVTWITTYDADTRAVISKASRYQITQVTRYKGDGSTWTICNPSKN